MCIDKYNTSSVMGVEWVRVMKTIDLAPCCPKGEWVRKGWGHEDPAGLK